MSNVKAFPPTEGAATRLCEEIVELVYSYDDRLSYAAAVGAIEIAKRIVMDGQVCSHEQ